MRSTLLFQASVVACYIAEFVAADQVTPELNAIIQEYPPFLQPALKTEVITNGALLDKRQEDGAICDTEDPLLMVMESDAEATPFCSSFLDIPTETSYGTYRPTVTTRVTSTDYLDPSGTVVVTETITATPAAHKARRREAAGQDAALASSVSSACSCIAIPTSTISILTTAATFTHTRLYIEYEDSPYTTTELVTVDPVPTSSRSGFSPTYSPPFYPLPSNSSVSPSEPLRTGTAYSSQQTLPTYSYEGPPSYSSPPAYNSPSSSPLYPTGNVSQWTVGSTGSPPSGSPSFSDASRTFSLTPISSTASVSWYHPSNTTVDTCTETVTAVPTVSGSTTSWSYITPSEASRTFSLSTTTSGNVTSTITQTAGITITVTVTATASTWTDGPWNSTLSFPTTGPTGTGTTPTISDQSRTGIQTPPPYSSSPSPSIPPYPASNSSSTYLPTGTGVSTISITIGSRSGIQTPPVYSSSSMPKYPIGNATSTYLPTGTGSSSTTTWTISPWNSTLSYPAGPTGTGTISISIPVGSRTGTQTPPSSSSSSSAPYPVHNSTNTPPTYPTGTLPTLQPSYPNGNTTTYNPTGTGTISIPVGSRTGSQYPPPSSTPKYPSGNSSTPYLPTGTGSKTTSWTVGPWNSSLTTPTAGPTGTGSFSLSISEGSRTGSQSPSTACPTASTVFITITATVTANGTSTTSSASLSFESESRVVPTGSPTTISSIPVYTPPTPPSYGTGYVYPPGESPIGHRARNVRKGRVFRHHA